VTGDKTERVLDTIPNESAELSKTIDDARAKPKALTPIFDSDVDVKVSEAIVSIVIEPLEPAFSQIAFQVDVCGIAHRGQSISLWAIVDDKSRLHSSGQDDFEPQRGFQQ